MTSSTRCSTSVRVLALVSVVAAAAGCGHRTGGAVSPPRIGVAEPGGRPRVALLPVDNLSGVAAPERELRAAVGHAFAGRVEIIDGDELERFLVRHRLRHTGGIDAASAKAARDELGADAVLVTSLTVYNVSPPALGITTRLVSTGEEPEVLWMDAFAWAGDQAPGLLGLGRMSRMSSVQDRVLERLGRSLDSFLAGDAPDTRCGGRRYRPKVRYRSPELDAGDRPTLAVVPFLDHSPRRGGGEVVALEFVRQLVASGRYRVLEPGVVRDYLLRARVIMPGGLSLEATRLILGGLGAQRVLSGVVLDFDDRGGGAGTAIRFRVTLLDGSNGDVLWTSSSFNRGNDGVFLFDIGRVGNSQDLTCRMVTGVADRMARPGGTAVSWARGKDQKDPQRFTRQARREREERRSGSGAGSTR